MADITIDNDGVALHVAIAGDADSPVVLLLHGITNSTAAWEWLVPHLAPRFRVLRLDFRGHGRSGRALGTYRFAAYVTDAIAVCEQVARRPCVLVGHSLGGATAAAVAQLRPELVRGIVLEDPALRAANSVEGNPLRGAFAAMRQTVPRLQERNISVGDLADRLAAAPSPTGPTFAELLFPDGIAGMAEGLLQLDASVLDAVLEGTMAPVFDPEKPITVPTLVLAADPAMPDAVVHRSDLERLAVHSPHARARVVAGAGHLIHDERANRHIVLEEVLAFLDSLPSES